MRLIVTIILFIGLQQISLGQDAEEYFSQGKKYAEASNFPMAIISYSLAINKNPYEWHYYQSRSYANFVTKNNSNALADINMALKLKPKHENAGCLSSRARILIDMRDYSSAIEDLNYIIDYFPTDFQAKYGMIHLERGKAFLYSGQKEKACNDFHESLSRHMSDANNFIKEFCK